MATLRIMMVGDVVGDTGRAMFKKHVQHLKKEYNIDSIILNGENSSSTGRGISPRLVQFFREHGVDVVTSGNHIWRNKEIYSYLNEHRDLLRPANFPGGTPGVGVTTYLCKGIVVGVINIQGRIFMHEDVDCPFRAVDSLLTYLKTKTNVILIDFHAEATSEKLAMAYYVDGRVSAQVGTHTHVQTADERILPGGTAYITDLGMAGSLNSAIGMQKDPILTTFLTQMPARFEVDDSMPLVLSAVCIEIESDTGRAVSIKRIYLVDNDVVIDKGI